MNPRRILVVGGGAAGFFAAITAADALPGASVIIVEKGARFLDKVRISGGGRCNVTHACFEPREFASRYPRGGRALLGPFQTFSARDTVEWFESRGVPLKAEEDGRMFPVSDSSQSILDCLMREARRARVELRPNCGVESVARRPEGGFEACLSGGGKAGCDALLLATGGCRAAAGGQLAVSLGHTLKDPVPSLFTFQVDCPWLRGLAGISLERVEVSVASAKLRETGPLLITHAGLSGPAVLRLSAWGARALSELGYRFPVLVNWLPHLSPEDLAREFQARREGAGAKTVLRLPLAPLPARLWEALALAAGVPAEARWSSLTRPLAQALTQQLLRTEFAVAGKSLNKDEFVTCGGVPLPEVNFKTMESRVCPGLHFAGEVLDIDGVTGGFNFQAAWTTGYLAGRAMAGAT